MFRKLENTPNDIFAIEISGTIEKKDYDRIDSIMEHYKIKHNHIKFLLVMHDFKWISSQAVWENLKIGLKYFKDIDKAAVVTDLEGVEDASEIMGSIAPETPFMIFHTGEREAALQWLNNNDKTD